MDKKQKPKPRSKNELERDRRLIADLYLKGKLQAEIAEALGVSQSTVSRDLTAIQTEWKAKTAIDLTEAKKRELARIDLLERTYWDAWQRSREKITYTTSKDVTGAQARSETGERVIELLGDPRFLAGVQWCIQQRCNILGILAAVKLDPGAGVQIEIKTVRVHEPEKPKELDDPDLTDPDQPTDA